MADGFEVSPQTLTAASSALTTPLSDLRQKVTDISSTTTSGNPWGADEPGSIFGGLYTAVVNHAIETVGSHADLVQYAQENLRGWAADHEQNDAAVEARFRSVGGA